MDNCTIPECDRQSKVKGFCHKHYRRQWDTPERRSWDGMKNRCYYKRHDSYHSYGGRGITVCDEWLHDFKAFYKYMGDKPTPEHSIDRINNDGNYEPGNVRWATPREQILNTRIRRDNTSGTKGISWEAGRSRWLARVWHNGKATHLGYFKTKDEAINARLTVQEHDKYNLL